MKNKFRFAIASLLAWAGVAISATAFEPSSRSRFFFNDDGDRPVFFTKGPVEIRHLQLPVDSLVGTPVTTLVYCVGDNVARYPSEVACQADWRRTAYCDKPGNRFAQLYEVTRQLRLEGIDQIKVIMDRAVEQGLEFVPSLRMNDGHFGQKEVASKHPLTSKFWMDNPELAITPGSERFPDCLLDFTHQKVRKYRLAQIEEIIQRYAVDGIELDFTRHYFFFPAGKERPELLTELVGKTRASLDDKSRQDGKRRMLIVRVAGSLAECRRLGCDVPAWIGQGLVDYVVPSSPNRYFTYDLPINEFADLAQGTLCRVVASPDSWKATPEIYRAGILNYYARGQRDTYLFNFFTARSEQREYFPYRDEDYALLRDLKGPVNLWGRSKHFGSDQFLVGNGITVADSGKPYPVEVYVGEDLPAIHRARFLESARWQVKLDELKPGEEIELTLNGHALPIHSVEGSSIVFEGKDALPELGRNALAVTLKKFADGRNDQRPKVTWVGLTTQYNVLGVETK